MIKTINHKPKVFISETRIRLLHFIIMSFISLSQLFHSILDTFYVFDGRNKSLNPSYIILKYLSLRNGWVNTHEMLDNLYIDKEFFKKKIPFVDSITVKCDHNHICDGKDGKSDYIRINWLNFIHTTRHNLLECIKYQQPLSNHTIVLTSLKCSRCENVYHNDEDIVRNITPQRTCMNCNGIVSQIQETVMEDDEQLKYLKSMLKLADECIASKTCLCNGISVHNSDITVTLL